MSLRPGGRDRLLLRDNVILDEGVTEEKRTRKKMQGMGIFGTLVLRGPMMDVLAAFFLEEFTILPRIGARDFRSQEKVAQDQSLVLSDRESWRQSRLQQEKDDGILWSAAKVRGCTVIKFGASAMEGGRHWIGTMLQQEGSVSDHFGSESTMCIR